jgi:hypothetical protein
MTRLLNLAPSLKVLARDEDDLATIAALLQDAIIPVTDMTYLPDEQTLAMVVNRFRWEQLAQREATLPTDEDGNLLYERINCGVRIMGVTAVKTRGFNQRDKNTILNMLTLTQPAADTIAMTFAGEAALALTVRELQVFCEDLGEGWPTTRIPQHELGDEPGHG